MTHFAHFDQDLDQIALELAGLGALCNVRLRDPGMVTAILDGHTPVDCNNHAAFEKMRGLLALAFKTIQESSRYEGAEATARMIHHAVQIAAERRDRYS
ncbi:MAG: hypothetical protein KDH20_21810 [Rhodocyclaceae bacterium]|nr:hypothetical protein [Rhodocyclaceae bacterium]